MTDIEGTRLPGRKSEDEKRQAIEELKRSCLDTKDLKARMDDKFLLRFLTARKFDQKKSLKLLTSYYSMRKKYRNIFSNFVPSAIKDILESGVFEILPQPDQLGRTVVIGRAYKWDVSVYSATDLLRAILMVLETALENESTQNNGIVLLYDSSGITWPHCWQFTPRMIYLIQLLLEDTFPARFKEWHIVNMHVLAKGIMSLVTSIVRPKLRKRIHLHSSSMDELHLCLSRECLPVEYGGHLEGYDTSSTMRAVLELEEVFQIHQECWNESAAKN